jgi:hypothetical protein
MTKKKMKIEVIEETKVKLSECSQHALDSLASLGSLKILGNMSLNYCTGLTGLPDELKVAGDLNLWDCTSLMNLSDDMKIKGDLNLWSCTGLTGLPGGLAVIGDLTLYGCKGIKSLPDDLQVSRIFCDAKTGFSGHEHEPGVIPESLKHKLR